MALLDELPSRVTFEKIFKRNFLSLSLSLFLFLCRTTTNETKDVHTARVSFEFAQAERRSMGKLMVIIPWLHPTAIVFTSVERKRREEEKKRKTETGTVVQFYCA